MPESQYEAHVPRALRQHCRHRGVELRSKLGSAVGQWQRKQQSRQNPMQPSPFHTARVDEPDWRRRTSRDPFAGLPTGWNVLHNVNQLSQGMTYLSGFSGGLQIGMLRYRQSLTVSSQVIPLSKFALAFRGLGTVSRFSGYAANALAPISIYGDYRLMQQNKITETRYAYRTTGTGTSLITTLAIGGSAGAGGGTGSFCVLWRGSWL